MKAKKITALLLAGAMALGLLACGSGQEEPAKEADSQEETPAADASEEQEADAGEPESEEAENATSTEEPVKEAEPQEDVELMVFAAASMTETLTQIGDLYMAENPGVTIQFNFDSSGTLKTQIQEGAACDLFISAGQTQMDQLDILADAQVNTEGLDYVLEDSRIDILENKVTLCVTEENKANIQTFDDMANALKEGGILLAMGNADVPVGQYTQKILEYYGLSEEELAATGLISYGSNVKEVTTQVAEGSVDCGVIYCTDAFSAGLEIADYATADMCGQVIYPASVLKTSENQEAAQAFLDYMLTDSSMEIFESVGFSPVE